MSIFLYPGFLLALHPLDYFMLPLGMIIHGKVEHQLTQQKKCASLCRPKTGRVLLGCYYLIRVKQIVSRSTC